MKTKTILVVSLILMGTSFINAQADYSDPNDVAQKFLNYCLDGKRYEACQLFATEESLSQIEILIKALVQKDIPLKDPTCAYFVNKCEYPNKNSALCYFHKKCNKEKNNKTGSLTLILIDDQWRVDYKWSIDKYL